MSETYSYQISFLLGLQLANEFYSQTCNAMLYIANGPSSMELVMVLYICTNYTRKDVTIQPLDIITQPTIVKEQLDS